MTSRQKKTLCLLLLLLLGLCSGCMANIPQEKQSTGETLPPVRSGPDATIGDAQTSQTYTMTLYMPSTDGTRLVPTVEEVVVQSGQTKQEASITALLALIEESGLNTSGQALRLAAVSNPVETTGELATVNLHPSIRYLMPEVLQFAVRMAIVNTLTELPETNYVSILVNGRDIGMDLLESIPTGLTARYPGMDVTNAWNQMQTQRETETEELQRTVALYFISDNGSNLLGETRNLTFSRQHAATYALELIEALGNGATRISGARTYVPSLDYFERNPALVQTGNNLYIELYLRPEVNDYLTRNNGTLAMTLSSICYTLTGFIPRLDGIITYVGGELVTSLALMNGEDWSSDTGQLTRENVLPLAADICTIYYPLESGAGLYPVTRPIAQRLRTQPRALMRELMRLPERAGLARALPEGVTDADILGLQVQDDTVIVNVTKAFASACSDLNSTQERNLVYAIVNTLTELEGIMRVRFYVEGEQVPLAGHMFMEGEFMRNTGLIYSGPLS